MFKNPTMHSKPDFWLNLPGIVTKLAILPLSIFLGLIPSIISGVLTACIICLFRHISYKESFYKILKGISEPTYFFMLSGILCIYFYMNTNWQGLILIVTNLFIGEQLWNKLPLWLENYYCEKVNKTSSVDHINQKIKS